jgi:hypothetical protein
MLRCRRGQIKRWGGRGTGQHLNPVIVPAFTFDYHYSMTHQNSSILLLAGKTQALPGLHGSTAVAKNIIKDIKRYERSLPGVSEGKVEEKKT